MLAIKFDTFSMQIEKKKTKELIHQSKASRTIEMWHQEESKKQNNRYGIKKCIINVLNYWIFILTKAEQLDAFSMSSQYELRKKLRVLYIELPYREPPKFDIKKNWKKRKKKLTWHREALKYALLTYRTIEFSY